MLRILLVLASSLAIVSTACGQTATVDFGHARPAPMPRYDARTGIPLNAPAAERTQRGYSPGSAGSGNTQRVVVAPPK